MNAAQIIEALGDTNVVAATFGVSAPAVSNWKSRGLPRSRLLDFVEAARSAGKKDITADVVRAAVAPQEPVEAASLTIPADALQAAGA